MVARHEMPGKHPRGTRPVRYDRLASGAIVSGGGQSVAPQITPFPTGRIMSEPFTRHFMPGYHHLSLRDKHGLRLRLTQMGGCRTRLRG